MFLILMLRLWGVDFNLGFTVQGLGKRVLYREYVYVHTDR